VSDDFNDGLISLQQAAAELIQTSTTSAIPIDMVVDRAD
jgi:hypothetical protein